jgi:hypothetical protein
MNVEHRKQGWLEKLRRSSASQKVFAEVGAILFGAPFAI